MILTGIFVPFSVCLSLLVLSSSDDSILSSLSNHLPKVDNDDRGQVAKTGSMCVSEDWHGDSSLGSELKKGEVKNLEETNSGAARYVETNGQQHAENTTEDQGASVEVILEPFDGSESDKDDDVDRKWFHSLKAHNRTSSKRFKCFVCGQRYDSISKHRISHSGCLHQSDSEENLHPKPEVNADRSDNELPSEGVCTDGLSNSSLPNVERSNDDNNLVCPACGRVFTFTYTNTRGFVLSVVKNRKSQTQVVLQALHITPQSDPEEASPSETETCTPGINVP